MRLSARIRIFYHAGFVGKTPYKLRCAHTKGEKPRRAIRSKATISLRDRVRSVRISTERGEFVAELLAERRVDAPFFH